MVNEMLKQLLAMVANAGIEGKFEIKMIQTEDNGSNNMAGIIVYPYNKKQGNIKISLFKEEGEVVFFTSSDDGEKFVKTIKKTCNKKMPAINCSIVKNK